MALRGFAAVAIVAAAAAGTAAEAAMIDYTIDLSGKYEFFAGQPQRTEVSLVGCAGPDTFTCRMPVDVDPGETVAVATYSLKFDYMGLYDPASAAEAIVNIAPVFTIAGQSVTLAQQFSLRQIGNGQFMASISPSEKATFNLGATGLLDVQVPLFQFQYVSPGADLDYQVPVYTRFTLRAPAAPPVPEPATWAMMIAGFGMVGVGMRRRQAILAQA